MVPKHRLIGHRSPLKYHAVFVDAPHVLEPVDLTGHGMTLDTFGDPGMSAASEDPALKPRAWFRSDPTRTRADGLEESIAYLRDTLKTQRFEVRSKDRPTWRPTEDSLFLRAS